MQILENQIVSGTFESLHDTLNAFSDKEKRQGAKWIKDFWKTERDNLAVLAERESNAYWNARRKDQPLPGTPEINRWLRLCAANAQIAAGAVLPDGGRYRVRSDQHGHWVQQTDGQHRCTCYFWSRYQGSRGPCKHILATQLYCSTEPSE